MQDTIKQEVKGSPYADLPLSKEAFMQAYLLNRALGHAGGIGVESVVKSADKAWNLLQKANRGLL